MSNKKKKSEYCKHLWKPLGMAKRDVIREIKDGVVSGTVALKIGDEVIAVLFCEKCGAWKSRKF